MNTRDQKSTLTIAQSTTPVRGGFLHRKCACGKHNAGEQCAACANNKSSLQLKLAIGASNDPLELEADRVANQVMATPAHSAVNCVPLRIQRYAGQASEGTQNAPTSVERVLASTGKPLDSALRQDMEQRFSHDFSRVRVHLGAAAEQSAQDVNASAYTVGHNIVFGAGQFAPGIQAGRRLLAHELTHVVQQGGTIGSFYNNAPAHSNEQTKPLPIMWRERDTLRRSPGCPNTVMTHYVSPISHRFRHSTHGPILLLGGVAKMEVGEDLMCTSRSFDGERLTETVTITSNNCPGTQSQQLAGGTFTVGTGTTSGNRTFPRLQNTFYDHHEMGMLDNPASMGRWRSRNCQIVREQRYSCGGVNISSHRITTTFRPVSSGDPNVTVVKRDINSCLNCGRSTP